MFAKPSDYAGASYFKPANHMNDLALLIEPKTIDRNVESTFNNQTRLRDEVIADISVFSNQAALESGEPTTIMKSTKVVHGMLTSTLEKILGGAMVATVTKIQTQAGSGFVWRDETITPEVTAQIEAYYNARSEATAAAPSFE